MHASTRRGGSLPTAAMTFLPQCQKFGWSGALAKLVVVGGVGALMVYQVLS